MTEKIRDKAGLVFLNCPHFKHLRENDLEVGRGYSKDEVDDLSVKGRLRIKTLDKKAEQATKKETKLKRKRAGKKNDPSIKKIRDHLRKVIKYHEEKVHEQIPSIYPLLGPANSDSENDSDEGGGEEGNGSKKEKREHTKKELKFYGDI